MSDRPPIPVEVVSSVLVASGHRCAVCGVPCPLERAHIVPWHKSRDHSAENLICLCANCHERADRERWGEEILRTYKARPWILRQNGNEVQENQATRRRRVKIVIAKDFEKFGQYEENILRHALANFLQVSETEVRIVSKQQGSIALVVSLPEKAAVRLRESYQLREEELRSALASFPILSLQLEEENSGLVAVDDLSRTPLDEEVIAGLKLMAAAMKNAEALYGRSDAAWLAWLHNLNRLREELMNSDRGREKMKRALEWIAEIDGKKSA